MPLTNTEVFPNLSFQLYQIGQVVWTDNLELSESQAELLLKLTRIQLWSLSLRWHFQSYLNTILYRNMGNSPGGSSWTTISSKEQCLKLIWITNLHLFIATVAIISSDILNLSTTKKISRKYILTHFQHPAISSSWIIANLILQGVLYGGYHWLWTYHLPLVILGALYFMSNI